MKIKMKAICFSKESRFEVFRFSDDDLLLFLYKLYNVNNVKDHNKPTNVNNNDALTNWFVTAALVTVPVKGLNRGDRG